MKISLRVHMFCVVEILHMLKYMIFNGLKWPFDFRLYYVFLCEVYPIRYHGRMCEFKGVYPPTHT